MSDGEAIKASFACAAARCGGAREALAVAVILYGLTRSAEALAGDPINAVEIQPIVGGTPLSLAFVPSKSAVGEPQFSADEFRGRNPGVPEAPAYSGSMNQTPTLPSTANAWQRLADYRSQGRVQLLTLWESTRSTVSLQAGNHGGPSLQWSRRLMGRSGATRGLLDRFVASSLSAAGLGSKAVARGSSPAAANKGNTLLPTIKAP
jgi:hypothetical protein